MLDDRHRMTEVERVIADARTAAPWSPVDDPYRDPNASAALFLSWMPALLCGARIEEMPVTYIWSMRGVRLSLRLPQLLVLAETGSAGSVLVDWIPAGAAC